MEIIWIGMAVVAFMVISGGLFFVVRARAKPRRLAFTAEEKALSQLKPLRDALRSLSAPQYRKQARRYQKRLRITLAVYAFERQGITVRDTISPANLAQAPSRTHDSLRELKTLFDKANELGLAQHASADMLSLYENACSFFGDKSSVQTAADR